uniref:Secreted protein n=1 Tax=Arundo donax TaxID=35708 RepID=A0A0A9A170_ARUDO
MDMRGGRWLLVVVRRLLGDAAGGLGGGAGVRLLLPEEGLHVGAPRHGSGAADLSPVICGWCVGRNGV